MTLRYCIGSFFLTVKDMKLNFRITGFLVTDNDSKCSFLSPLENTFQGGIGDIDLFDDNKSTICLRMQ